MKWILIAGLICASAALPLVAATRSGERPLALPQPSAPPADPTEADFQKVMALDDDAHEEIDKWIKENGAFAKKGAGLGDAVLSLKNEQRLAPVKRAYEDFLQRHPRHARGQLAFGSFLNDLGEEAEARKRWEKALELDPTNPAAFNNLANSYGQTGPAAKAFELYSKAIEMNPRQAIYHHNLGSAIVLHCKAAAAHYRITEQQALRNALDLYRQAEKLDPTNFQLATDIAQVYYALQPPANDAAIAAWLRAQSLARDDQEREATHLHLARVKAAAGKLSEARTHLNSVTNAALANVKDRLARELADPALSPAAEDHVPRLRPPLVGKP